MNNERLADLFIDHGLMDRAQADDVLLETTQNGKAIDQAMVDHGIVDEAQFYQAIADALGTEVVISTTSSLPRKSCVSFPAVWRVCIAPCQLARRTTPFAWR